MKELYEWLGWQAQSSFSEYNEAAVNLDESVGTLYRAGAFLDVREHMRRMDPSLAAVKEIDEDCQP